MTPTPVHDELWAAVEPLLPPSFPRARGGRPPAPDRAALSGIVFVLCTGAPWRSVPLALGCSGVTCWRRLRDWQAAGVWRRLHRVLLELLQGAGLLDWHREGQHRQRHRPRRGGRRGDRPEPGRSRQAGHEAPPAG